MKAPPVHLVPALEELARQANLEPDRLSVALESDQQGHVRVLDKHSVPVTNGEKAVFWPVASLSALFRGAKPAPPDIQQYPPEYAMHYFFIEHHFLTLCSTVGDRSDQEMHEIYAELRRRPDGRSLGVNHDFMWQVMALLLGRYELSESEYHGLLDSLVRSTRKWSMRPISRNYASFLRKNLST